VNFTFPADNRLDAPGYSTCSKVAGDPNCPPKHLESVVLSEDPMPNVNWLLATRS